MSAGSPSRSRIAVTAASCEPRAEHLTATASEAATENIPGRDLTCILLRLHYLQGQ